MAWNILKKLLWSAIISSSVSIFISWANYQSKQGLEERQGIFILFMLSLLLCFINFLLSLTALFNVRADIRSNKTISLLSFVGLPVLLFLMLFVSLAGKNLSDYVSGDLAMTVSPSVLYISTLSFFYSRFRKEMAQGEEKAHNHST